MSEWHVKCFNCLQLCPQDYYPLNHISRLRLQAINGRESLPYGMDILAEIKIKSIERTLLPLIRQVRIQAHVDPISSSPWSLPLTGDGYIARSRRDWFVEWIVPGSWPNRIKKSNPVTCSESICFDDVIAVGTYTRQRRNGSSWLTCSECDGDVVVGCPKNADGESLK